MKKIFCFFVLFYCLGLFAYSCPADIIITSLDFEGGNDASNAFGFGGGNGATVGIGVNQNFMESSNGTEVAEFEVTSVSGNPTFAGGGLGVFDLSADPSFVSGNLTVADLDRLRISFDVEIEGAVPILFRLERSGGTFFNDALDLNVTPTANSGFQNVSVDLATLDLQERNDLVNVLNGGTSTDIQLVFQFDVNPLQTDNIVRIDNLLLTSVPEPSGIWLLGVCGLAYFRRRGR